VKEIRGRMGCGSLFILTSFLSLTLKEYVDYTSEQKKPVAVQAPKKETRHPQHCAVNRSWYMSPLEQVAYK
jgi:hypothetical protein